MRKGRDILIHNHTKVISKRLTPQIRTLNLSVQCKEAHEQLLVDALHDHPEGLTRMDVKAVFEPDGQMKRIEKIFSITDRKLGIRDI